MKIYVQELLFFTCEKLEKIFPLAIWHIFSFFALITLALLRLTSDCIKELHYQIIRYKEKQPRQCTKINFLLKIAKKCFLKQVHNAITEHYVQGLHC